MPNFAVIDGESVLNTIVADSQAIAEEVTGKTCIEFTTEGAEPGGTYSGGVFIKRKPYPSWVLDESNNWQAPVAHPEVDPENPQTYTWDEASVEWVVVTPEA
jgi:hypothetical protein